MRNPLEHTSMIKDQGEQVSSGTPDSGLSQIRTQYNKHLYKGQDLRFQNTSLLEFYGNTSVIRTPLGPQ